VVDERSITSVWKVASVTSMDIVTRLPASHAAPDVPRPLR
jgi:hypothetical protein